MFGKFMKVKCALIGVSLISIFSLYGCSEDSQIVGDSAFDGAYKIKSSVTLTATGDAFNFETYVDSAGNGEGLMQFDDAVYKVGISQDAVYIVVDTALTIRLDGVNGHFISSSTVVESGMSVAEMAQLGFSVVDGMIVAYHSEQTGYSIDSQYSASTTEFNASSYDNSKSITPGALAELLEAQISGGLIPAVRDEYAAGDAANDDRGQDERNRLQKLDTFYNESRTGVKISNQVFSIGDSCNPSTYFMSMIPEGITQKKAYSSDEQITVDYVSYLSKDGKTTFSVVGGYVRSIYTTCPFSWCGISTDMTQEELESYIGEDLSRSEREETGFQIPFSGLEYVDQKSKTYQFVIDGLTCEISIGDSGNVGTLYLHRTLDFENYSNT